MQIYCLRLYNFFRFSNKDNSIIFDMLPEYSEMSLDDVYDKIKKNPIEHIKKVKEKGVTNLTAICGFMNGDYSYSNGCGKSSVLEAICYNLFEQIVRHTCNNDKTEKVTASIITKINGEYPADVSEAYVEMIFEENDKVYILRRGRELQKNRIDHKKILKFDCVNDDKLDSHSGHRTTDTEESISKVINISYDLFVNSILFGQNDMGKFLSGSDLTRKEMLIELLRFDDLINGMLQKTRDRKNDKQKDVEKCSAQILLMDENLQMRQPKSKIDELILAKEDAIKECNLSLEKFRQDLTTLQGSDFFKELENIKSDGTKVKTDLNNKKKDKESRIQEWVNLSSDIDRLIYTKGNEITDSNNKGNDLVRKLQQIEQNVAMFNMDDKKKELEKVDKAKLLKPKYSDKTKELLDSKEKNYGNITTLESNINRHNKEIDLLTKQIESGVNQFVCDKCKSVVDKKHIENEIGKNKTEKQKFESELALKKEEQKKYMEELKDSRDKMDKITEWINKEATIHSEIKDFENNKIKIKEIKETIEENNKSVQKLTEEKKEAESKKVQYSQKVNDIGKTFDAEIIILEAKIKELTEKYKEVDKSASEIKNKIAVLNKSIEEKSQNKSTYNSQIGSLKKEIEVLEEETKKLASLRNKIEEEKVILNRLQTLEVCLGLGGIQNRIIDKYLPLLNTYIEEFIMVLSGGNIRIKITINEKGKIDIMISGGSANTYEMLSGGEKTICKLAISVSIALLSFTRCNHKPEFIAIDEAFSSLDESRTVSAFDLLAKLQEKFARILIISHKKDINDKIVNKILVEKEEGMHGRSRIKAVV